MPITIGSNIAALRAQMQLAKTSNELASVYERLSSGMRINKASDDAAGLSIAAQLNSDRRVFNQGIRNLNDGISLLNVADSAIESLANITIRLKELAEQSANGTYSTVQRQALDKEAQALSKEYTRIIQSTKFNDRQLLTSSFGELRLQGGYGLNGGIQSGLGGTVGTGAFSAAVSYNGTPGGDSNLNTVKVGDLNGDGIDDLVYNYYSGVYTNRIAVRLGTTGGTFGSPSTYIMESVDNTSLSLGDINNDGILDVVTSGDGTGTVRLGNGDGTFAGALTYTSGVQGVTSLLSDLNEDGNLDLVITGGSIAVLLGNGSGSFSSPITYASLGGAVFSVAAADLNSDGILDLVSGAVGAANIMLGKGDGTFQNTTSLATVAGSNYLTLGDVNGDGKADLVSSGNNNSIIRLGQGDGTFGNITTYQMLTSNYGTELGDLNGDGFLDLVTSGYEGVGAVRIRLGQGNGTFGNSTSYFTQSPTLGGISLGDLKGDGVLDIVAAGYTGEVYAFNSINTQGVSILLDFDLKSGASALQALSKFDQALKRLTQQRGQIGAFQARVEVGKNNLQSASENYAAAESRIRDADIAQEAANLVRLQILQQASAAILGQANLQPQLALRLLNGGRI